MHLTEKQKELIERFGVYSEREGTSPAPARIAALLLVSDNVELTFEEIYETLQISKSAASNAINSLLASEKIEYITKPGDRKRYFRSKIAAWDKDFSKKISRLFEASKFLKDILEQRPDTTPEFNAKLQQIISFIEFLQSELPDLYKKWELRTK
ncbi:MAG TPA: MarR family transcriptional regulator [Cytophagales bacterium]|nr:MarR family transcriptional regulator [Cytophagales bacterium]